MDELMVKSLWASACQSASSFAESMARMERHRRGAELIAAEAHKFLEQEPPDNNEELARRQLQQLGLSSRIGSITYADTMARMHPDVADAIFDETAKFCEGELPKTSDGVSQLQMAGIALTSKISGLCSANSMSRLVGSFRDEPEFDEVVRLGQEIRHSGTPNL
jgi:hypothetical protein